MNVRGTSLKKVDYMIADHSGTVKMTVWERVVNLEIGKTYNIDNVSVRTFNGVKYLTTTKYTTVNQCEDLSVIADVDLNEDNHGKCISGSIVGINLINFETCMICNAKIQDLDASRKMIKCLKCNMIIVVSKLRKSCFCKLMLRII